MITFQFEARGDHEQVDAQIHAYMEGFFGEEWRSTYQKQANIDVLVHPEAAVASDDGHHALHGYVADVSVTVH